MIQYIDKSALVAEIEDWRDKIRKCIFDIPLTGSDRAYATFEYEILGKIKDFIDTLEVKEVEEEPVTEDLEEATDNALSNVLNTHEIVNIRSCLEMFRYGAKWKEQLMKDNPYK